MSDEYNFSELRSYLEGQIDMGDAELYLDEPWSPPVKRAAAPAAMSAPAIPRPAPRVIPPRPAASSSMGASLNPPPPMPAPSANPQSANPQNIIFEDLFGSPSAPPTMSVPAAEPSQVLQPMARAVSNAAYMSADSLEAFFGAIKSETIYAKEPSLAKYLGPAKPRLLLLLPAVKPGENPEAFFSSPVGEMLVRLFANLGYTQEQMGVTYFFKSTDRPIAPLMATALKKMLTKELSLISPEVVVTFGVPLFQNLFGRAKNFDDLAGTDLEVGGFKTCSLIDPYAMVNDKQMKWLTWKIHIPRSSYFTVKQ